MEVEEDVGPVVVLLVVDVAVAAVEIEVVESVLPLVEGPGLLSEPHAVTEKIASPRATLMEPDFRNRVCIFFLIISAAQSIDSPEQSRSFASRFEPGLPKS